MKTTLRLITLAITMSLSVFAQIPYVLKHNIPAPPVGLQSGAELGFSVAVDGGYTVVGAPSDDTGASDAGVVKVFNSISGTLLFVIPNPSPEANDRFGYAVAISGTRVVVGAYSDNTGGTWAGSAYVFDLSSSTPTIPLLSLHNPTPAAYDVFGASVGISGTRVVVGAPYDDTGAEQAGTVYVYDVSGVTPTVPVVTLNKANSSVFGIAVGISGSRVVVGQQYGGAYVYDVAGATPSLPVTTLGNPHPGNPGMGVGTYFGSAVGISGNRVIVGDPIDDTGANDAGRAYVYELTGASNLFPIYEFGKISPTADDNFGGAVAISGTRVVIGVYKADTGAQNSGVAYVYDVSNNTPTVPVATLNNPTPGAEDRFGGSVAISGARVVVGAHYDDTGASEAGSAYVYDLTNGTPSVPAATLNSPGPKGDDNFGVSVALSGNLMVVGAYLDSTGAANSGSAYVFDLRSATPTIPVFTLNNPTPASSDYFGWSVAISGTRVVIGAYRDVVGGVIAGSVYVYELTSGTPMVPVVTLNNPNPTAVGEHFGFSVAISSARVLVGAYNDDTGTPNNGRVYVFDINSGTPTVPSLTLNNPTPAAGDYFGISVAVSGTRVVVGDSTDDTGATDAGRAYVFDLANGTPTIPVATLNNPGPGANDQFGRAVAISATRVIVGAPNDDTGDTDAGGAYVYQISGATPTVPVAILNNPGPQASESFGSSVAISGTRLVVGARYDDMVANQAGSAYVYELSSGTPTLPVATLSKANPGGADNFGNSVAIDSATVAIGIPRDDATMRDKGAAYVFGPPNAAPSANNDLIELPMDHFNVKSNDTDSDGDPLTITTVGSAAHGTSTLNADNTVSYTPDATFAGTDSFNYTISDGFGGAATGTVTVRDTTAPTITFTPPPQAVNTGNSPTAPLPDIATLVNATDNVAVVSITQSPIAGTAKAPGIYNVVVTVSDAAGLTAQTTVQVTVFDNFAPTITLTPAPQTVNTGNSATAALPDVAALVSATDNVGVVSKTQSPAAGTQRVPGTYNVVVTASDAAGLTAQTTVEVTVRDNFAPTITFTPSPQTVNTGNNATAALPNIAALVSATDNVGVVSKTQSPAAGALRAPGTYDVVVTVLDAAGNPTQTTVQVTVNDNFAPSITFAPPPQTVNTGNNATAALPDLTVLVTAADNVGVVSVTQSPTAGTQKVPGTYGVVVTVSDAAGLTAQTTVQVTVNDNFAPTITSAPPAQTVNTGNSPTAPLPDIATLVTATDNVGVVSKTQSPAAGTQKVPGTYNVVVTASDAAGLTAQTTVQVTVRDSAAPVFTTVPPARSIRAGTDQASIATPDLTGEAAATDNIGVVGITQSLLAGSTLAVGVRTITLTATDAAGNSSTANVEVTVLLGNRTPVPGYDSVFAMSRTVTFDVLANDSDADGDAISLVSFTQPAHGRVTRVGNSLRFDPALGVAVAGEFFTYTISDGEVTAVGTVEVSPVPNSRRFSGVVDDAGGPCGLVTLAFTKPGNFTGILNKDGIRHAFTGAINLNGLGVGVVRINVTTQGAMTFRPGGLTPSGEPRMLVGITGVAAMPTAEVFVEQSPYWAKATTTQDGQFSVALKKDTTPGNSRVSGYAVVKLSRNGATTHVGKAPNGQTFSSSGQILSGGRIGLHGALGAASVRRGFVAGMLVLDTAGNTISGDLRWKLPPLRDVRYPAGLDTMLSPIGDRYTRATTAHGALGETVPTVRTFEFSEGVFAVPVFANVTFGVPLVADTFQAPITYFATSPSIGRVAGYAKPATIRYSFDGIILQLRGEIHGAVRSTTTLSAARGL